MSDAEPHPHEDADHLVERLGDRVPAARDAPPAGHRNVDPFSGEALCPRRVAQGGQRIGNALFDSVFDLIEERAHRRPVGGRHVAQPADGAGQVPFATEDAHAHLLDVGLGACRLEGGKGRAPNLFQECVHG